MWLVSQQLPVTSPPSPNTTTRLDKLKWARLSWPMGRGRRGWSDGADEQSRERGRERGHMTSPSAGWELENNAGCWSTDLLHSCTDTNFYTFNVKITAKSPFSFTSETMCLDISAEYEPLSREGLALLKMSSHWGVGDFTCTDGAENIWSKSSF